MKTTPVLASLLLVLSLSGPALAADAAMDRAEALSALGEDSPARRLQAVERLAEVGSMADGERLAARLRDADETVRLRTVGALWTIWSRSGDKAVDQLFQRGIDEMAAGELRLALETFGEIVQREPAFAEGWNKRATVLFLLGRHEESLKDCDEVLKRNHLHFGALSGMAQIHFRLGDPERALQAYERALQVNPNLSDGAETLKFLEDAVRARQGRRV